MSMTNPRDGVTLRPPDFLPPQRPPGPADYRELAELAYAAADEIRGQDPLRLWHWPGGLALDALGWEAERAAEDLEELGG